MDEKIGYQLIISIKNFIKKMAKQQTDEVMTIVEPAIANTNLQMDVNYTDKLRILEILKTIDSKIFEGLSPDKIKELLKSLGLDDAAISTYETIIGFKQTSTVNNTMSITI
jgi:hypothetical protein